MAGCVSCTEGGNVSPENVKRWTERLSNVLHSPKARNKFKIYLTDSELEEGRSLVEFWEMCGEFRDHHTQRRQENLEQQSSSSKTGAAGDTQIEDLWTDAEKIVQFAEDNIPFDKEMKCLKAAFCSRDTKKIGTAIEEAKQSAVVMLKRGEDYKAFCQYLLKRKVY